MNHNESPHIQSQCCKKIIMFGYISLTNLYDEHLIMLVLVFFNIDNFHISIPSYIITMLLHENLNVRLYQFNNANEGP